MNKIFSQKSQFMPGCKLEPMTFLLCFITCTGILLLKIIVWMSFCSFFNMLLTFNLICEFDRFDYYISSPKQINVEIINITVSKPPLGLLFFTKLQ